MHAGRIGLIVVLIALISTILAPNASAAPSYASGTVQCASGNEVAGVWVAAKNGGSNWAKVTKTRGLASHARFEYKLPKGGQYLVNVGCGWKNKSLWDHTKVWKTTNRSVIYVSGARNFLCYDVKAYIPKNLSNSVYQTCIV